MPDELEPLHVLIGMAAFMLVLHLTIVPLAWAGAMVSDGLEALAAQRRRTRRIPRRAR